MTALKIRRIGNSLGVVLPKEMLTRLRAGEGDKLFVHETKDGYAISPHDEELERQLAIARGVMDEYRDVLRELAK